MSTSIQEIKKFNLLSSFFTNELITKVTTAPESHFILDKSIAEKHKQKMLAVAQFIVNLLEKSSQAFLNKDLKKFDANPGDCACQARALKLHQLMHVNSLSEEAETMQTIAKNLKNEMQAYLRNSKVKNPSSAPDFFKKNFGSLEISEDMLYLFQTYLLTVTKVVDHTEENGIIVTKTEVSKLTVLSKKIGDLIDGNIRLHLVENIASQLSRHSIEAVRKINSNLHAKDALITEMLSEAQIHQISRDNNHVSKSSSCGFFEVQALLQYIKEQKAVIAFKSIVKKGETPCHFFLRGYEQGITFLSKEESQSLDSNTPLIIFEGVITDDQTFREKVEKIGFEKTILIAIAQSPPFDTKSSIDDVKSLEARKLIETYRSKAKELNLDLGNNPFLFMDHVFCTTFEHEINGKKV